MADLRYNVVEMQLTGSIDGYKVDATAYSGGRAGSKQRGVVHPILANNPFLTSVKKVEGDDKTIGGTLPLGMYELRDARGPEGEEELDPAQSDGRNEP